MNLKTRIKAIEKIYQKLSENLKSCTLCPRNCQINRLNNELGYCGQGKKIKIYNSFLHFGEEPPVSGKRGSGTVFFSGCSLRCVYCQNYKFSQQPKGEIVEEESLAQIMVDLARNNAENINLVTPAHFLPQILKALKIFWEKGLKLPIIYNSSGYEQKEIVEVIEPIIDSWLIDFKYINSETAKNYSNSPQYPRLVKNTLTYLCKQKNGQNKLNKGQIPPIIIRHLILPGHIDETKRILAWIKKNTPQAWISVMSQYQPYFKAKEFAKINRTLSLKEYNQIKELVEKLELKGWLQEFKPQENLAGVHFKKGKQVNKHQQK